jgi:hypothetical protein
MGFGEIIRCVVAAALDQDPLETERKLESQRDGGFDVGVFKAGGSAIETKSYGSVPIPRDPNEALSLLNKVASFKKKRFCFIVDEFDQLENRDAHLQLGLLAKLIADSGSNSKFIFCGVADNIQQIFKAHPSTLRLFEAIEVNRLGLQACFDIMQDVEERLGIKIERETQFRIAQISDGFPYFIHLIVEKTIWRWFFDPHSSPNSTSPEHYEKGLIDASRSAAVELREPYEEAANKYALDGELLIWALATGNLLEKQIKVIAKDFVGIFDTYDSNAKPDCCLNQNQIAARLIHFMEDRYGRMVIRPRRSYYAFSEKRMRGYARLRAELQGFSLRPDHPLISRTTYADAK